MCRGCESLHPRFMAATTGKSPHDAASFATDAARAENLLNDLEQHRRELIGYCSLKLGSILEADDAAQETILKAWRGMARFEERSTMRTWLYRIATNVCLDMLRRPQQRALPIGLGLSPAMDSISSAMLARHTSARTVCDRSAQWGGDDPAELTESRESVRLALATALRHLPPRQVAVLILRDVLRWSAADVAQLLGTTVTAVNERGAEGSRHPGRSRLRPSSFGPVGHRPPGSAREVPRGVRAFRRRVAGGAPPRGRCPGRPTAGPRPRRVMDTTIGCHPLTVGARGRRSGHSRFIIARASFSMSMKRSPETSTITCLMAPPVNAQGAVPG